MDMQALVRSGLRVVLREILDNQLFDLTQLTCDSLVVMLVFLV